MTQPLRFQMDIPDPDGNCTGMPAGFESPCGQITEPHGPHPLYTPATDRAHVVAAIHAYAEWLAANPDVPLPTDFQATRHSSRHDGDSVAEARHMITHYDAARHLSGNSGWATTVVMDTPVKIEHTVFCERPQPHPEDGWL